MLFRDYVAVTLIFSKQHKERKHEGVIYLVMNVRIRELVKSFLKRHKESKHEEIKYPSATSVNLLLQQITQFFHKDT